MSKKGSKKAPIPGAFHCEETAGRFSHSANRKRLALAELRRTTSSLETVLAYSLAPVFLDFMGFLASALKCCPSI